MATLYADREWRLRRIQKPLGHTWLTSTARYLQSVAPEKLAQLAHESENLAANE